ncbi:MAG: hydantoinase/carbamoylase family amidase [Alphaproteobacteria bacterium]|nr:hydantoinase/carbamoylase family amidase [Alphaproteobacteria bacterium]
MSAAARAAAAVDRDRLWQLHMDFAALGATPGGGVNRQALSPEDIAARRHMVAWAGRRGFNVATDDFGNLFVRRAGRDRTAPPVVSGSHLDSQPKGGRFDGAYGVLAACEALAALDDAGIVTERPVEAVAWVNEEGSRFSPGMMGSAIYAGLRRLADTVDVLDPDGVRLGDALAAFLAATPDVSRRPFGLPLAAYVEAHIEQGPRLEAARRTIGIVGGIQGMRWFELSIAGRDAHAGTTPRAARRDAMRAAAEAVTAMAAATDDAGDALRFTVGRFVARPGSPNTVPGRVDFTIDLRHPDDATLDATAARLRTIVTATAGARDCMADMREIFTAAPTLFDATVVGAVRRQAEALGLAHMDIFSGAGHDAMWMARLCPTGMIFVPCAGGLSHNEAESATPEDLAAGTRVLAACLVELAGAA